MMKLSIIMPVYNERATILEILKAVEEAPLPDGIAGKEIIIVDDCSRDGTSDILKTLESKYKVFYHEKNKGKGGALKTGFANVTGDLVLIQDADLEYNPQEYSKLLRPILEGKADVVYGSRFAGGESYRVLFFWHMVGNKLLTLFSNMLTNLTLTDIETCYKAFTHQVLDQITVEEDRFGFEPEFTAKVAKLDVKIYEVGISYSGRGYKEGKKINWKDGFSAIRCIIKYNIFR